MHPTRSAPPQPPRRDGWTAHRQLRFLTVLTHTRSVGLAAACVGMSRESAYRLRSRDPHGLFAHMWKKALGISRNPDIREVDEGHTRVTLDTLAGEGNGFLQSPPHRHLRELRADGPPK